MPRILRHILTAQAWQAVILFCTMLVQLSVARFIGSSGAGVTAIIVSGASFCTLLIELNLQSALVRSISRATVGGQNDIRDNTLGGRLSLAILAAPIVGGLLSLTATGNRFTVFAGVVGAVMAQELNTTWWLQGLNQTGRAYIQAGAIAICSCAVGVVLIYETHQPGVDTLTASAAGLLIYSVYWWRTGVLSIRADRLLEYSVKYFKFALENRSFLVGGLAIYLYLYPAQLLLAATRSVQEAGLYRVALMPSTAYYAIVVAAFYVYYPEIVRAHEEGIGRYDFTVRRLFLALLTMGIFGCLGMIELRNIFLTLVGKGFVASANLAPVLVASKAIGGIGLLARAVLLARGRETFVYLVFVSVGVVAVATNSFMIPHYGIYGAAMTEIMAETVHLGILSIALIDRKK
jgi:O-antigen/teichoic acid export membrane protein